MHDCEMARLRTRGKSYLPSPMERFFTRFVLALGLGFYAFANGADFTFREGHLRRFHIAEGAALSNTPAVKVTSGTNQFEITSRLTVQVQDGAALKSILAGRPLKVARQVTPNIFILQAPDALTAAREAHRLASTPGVLTSIPVLRRPAVLHGQYAYKPNDPYAFNQWHLEQRNPQTGAQVGPDMNARAAWPYTLGQGVTVAVVDDGIEYTHPELSARAAGAPHFNFYANTTNGMPDTSIDKHATAVAGLIAAELNNNLGGTAVAPGASLASWKIFGNGSVLATDEELMDMFQYASNIVAVQNHSWGSGGDSQIPAGLLAAIGVSNAVQFGRDGKGSVIVRSAGNFRVDGGDANDDGFLADPHVTVVGAVRIDGRVASYSNPGACLLVSAPGGETNSGPLFTTDRQGTLGYNTFPFYADPTLPDYCFDSSGFVGTSAAAPLVAGVAALALSANTNLTYRDVQQILLLSARHFDLADPGLMTNAAGLRVSHNQGFGIPDAGAAVQLALRWQNRPPASTMTLSDSTTNAIPDDGLQVVVSGLSPIAASPSLGIQADSPTPSLPLVDVGMALGPISQNLTNQAALIQRGNNNFFDKINYAAQAGAAFAIVYNNTGTTDRVVMGTTDFVPIPAVFIGKNDGDSLHNLLLQTNLQAQLATTSATYSFVVTNTWLCEHVSVRLQTDHPRRGDLRITLRSPQGTVSVLDHLNSDPAAGPVDWTYCSTHHFYESSYGTWTINVTDERTGSTGSVQFCALTIEGVPITDSDHDGLDDNWELAHFGTLTYGPKDDPDGDGYNNISEQIMGTDPLAPNRSFTVDFSRWNETLARVSWPSKPGTNYDVLSGANIGSLSVVTNLTGTFPETEWFVPYTNAMQFFQVRGQ
jgi:subtilisin family serine protease/subtilisin-like proprotein convertase family protein